MDEIIVIRAADPDGSVFQAVMDALKGKRAEMIDVVEQSASCLLYTSYLLALAQVNNAFAARADAVVRVVCGIPVYYKGVEK